jgi:hypothetical protein
MSPTRFCFATLGLLAGCLGLAATTEKPMAELDLGAMVQPAAMETRFSEEGYYVWCGSLIQADDGKYYLFYSRWPKAKGFAGWVIHSEIAYATGDDPLGPFVPAGAALPARGSDYWDGSVTHNPQIIKVGNKFCLFYTGNRGDGQSFWVHRNQQRIGVATADHPAGPWKRLDQPIIDVSGNPADFDSLCVANPAATVRPDGSILLLYKAVRTGKAPRGGVVRFGAALAATPEGPYQKQTAQVFAPDERHSNDWMVAEDPFIWFSEKQGARYYAITRDVVGMFTGHEGGIALFNSADGLHWQPAANPIVLGKLFKLTDGTLSSSKLERPQLWFDRDGTPRLLLGAVSVDSPKPRTDTFNIRIPLREE